MPDLRTLPLRHQQVVWRLERREALVRLRTQTQVLVMAPPFWRARWEVVTVRESERRRLQAWLDALAGGARFLGHHPLRKYPAAHPRGIIVGPPAGTVPASVAATVVTATTVTLPAVAGLDLRAGDMIGLVKTVTGGALRTAHEVTARAGAVLTVTPPIDTGRFNVPVTVELVDPVQTMILDPAAPPEVAGMAGALVVSIAAMAVPP